MAGRGTKVVSGMLVILHILPERWFMQAYSFLSLHEAVCLKCMHFIVYMYNLILKRVKVLRGRTAHKRESGLCKGNWTSRY